MRISCNGCRVLRKGCSDDCPIRPCLNWITSPESQANATLFLAKFYGRTGLANLIKSGPENLRPEIFKSLLYEACGRIVNPIHGSTGLLSSGNWHLGQAAVEAVLNGAPITKLSSGSAFSGAGQSLKACDIRHVSKEESSSVASEQLHKVKSRSTFKRSGSAANKPKKLNAEPGVAFGAEFSGYELSEGMISRDSDVSPGRGDCGEGDSVSVETVEASLVKPDEQAEGNGLDLELRL